MAYRPLRELGDSRAWLERGSVALEALHDSVLREESEALARQTPCSVSATASTSARTGVHTSEPPPEIVLHEFGGHDFGRAATLRLGAGEIVCIVGPTGSGKTTLLRAMLGLERARGKLLIAGRDSTNAPSGPESRPFAWVPQEAPLVTGTVVDNVALFARQKCVDDALALVGVDGLGDASDVVGPGGRSLSGGERRLLSIARAIASELPVLLMDEPTEGLDASATTIVLDAVRSLRGRRSMLIATHRIEVMRIADRVVALDTVARAANEADACVAAE
jgi:ABC-type transport system involved in cytochrome bd biosynthesis fused ATPase/permease subunit